MPGHPIYGAEEIDHSPILLYGGWGNNMDTDCFVHFVDKEPEALTGEIKEL